MRRRRESISCARASSRPAHAGRPTNGDDGGDEQRDAADERRRGGTRRPARPGRTIGLVEKPASSGSAATAIRPEIRPNEPETPAAMPLRSGGSPPRVTVASGAISSTMPTPHTTMPGNSPVQYERPGSLEQQQELAERGEQAADRDDGAAAEARDQLAGERGEQQQQDRGRQVRDARPRTPSSRTRAAASGSAGTGSRRARRRRRTRRRCRRRTCGTSTGTAASSAAACGSRASRTRRAARRRARASPYAVAAVELRPLDARPDHAAAGRRPTAPRRAGRAAAGSARRADGSRAGRGSRCGRRRSRTR